MPSFPLHFQYPMLLVALQAFFVSYYTERKFCDQEVIIRNKNAKYQHAENQNYQTIKKEIRKLWQMICYFK